MWCTHTHTHRQTGKLYLVPVFDWICGLFLYSLSHRNTTVPNGSFIHCGVECVRVLTSPLFHTHTAYQRRRRCVATGKSEGDRMGSITTVLCVGGNTGYHHCNEPLARTTKDIRSKQSFAVRFPSSGGQQGRKLK